LRQSLPITDRYASFLVNADPLDVETATPPERIRFVPGSDLEHEQRVMVDGDEDNPPVAGWRDGWVVIAHSAMLGDPYFLDTSRGDAEGDCPVYTAMAGTDRVEPVLCATSFATFIQILAAAMEVAEGFGSSGDPDDEHIFKEALAPKLRVIDPAALREGHWTS
ncbi:MAG: hypothetical protein RIF41_10460, partial [Polyangiaceae bacterium]